MGAIAEHNFYDVLEVSQEATLQEIERAYRIARATYQPNSLATYSLFSESESGEILRRVEEAYAVLSDARLRREYDARLRREGSSGAGEKRPAREAPPRAPQREPAAPAWSPSAPSSALELGESLEPEDGVYDGRVLRRIRMSRGIELEEISAVTKIHEGYLRSLEENRYPDLPAPVYVRGFLREYAKYLRLDPRRVTESYMTRISGAPGGR